MWAGVSILAQRSFVIVLVLVLVLEKIEPYETFERERGPDNITGDTILQQTDSALARLIHNSFVGRAVVPHRRIS